MQWSRYLGKPHDCSSPSQSWSLCISQLWETGAEAHRQHRAELTYARHTLQAEKAVEPRRPRARPLTLCLLRMKREDFITSCRPRLHPSSLPPPQALSPSPPLLPHYLPASLPHSQPVARSRACPSQEGEADCQRKSPIPTACQHCAVHRERGAERDEEGEEETERGHTAICLF